MFCFFVASSALAAELVSLSTLRGDESFVFAGVSADDIDWELAGEPKGPHGGYRTTSQKCVTCHSAHGAVGANATGIPGTNLALNRSATGCAFCHTLGAPAAPNGTPEDRNLATDHVWVYTATNGNTDSLAFADAEASGHRIGEVSTVPASSIDTAVTLACSTCHLVHGNTVGAWLPTDIDPTAPETTDVVGYKFLRDNPAGAFRSTGDPLRNAKVPNNAYEATLLYGDATNEVAEVNQYTLSVWCANCHDYTLRLAQPVLSDGSPSVADSFVTFGSLMNTVHVELTDDKVLAEGYATGLAHRVPMQGAYSSMSGSMECYSCHRGGLSAEGGTPATAGTSVEKCARCHFGYEDYANDAKRLASGAKPNGDFPHSATGARALLGDFILDGTDPYAIDPIPSGTDDLGGKTVNETLRGWSDTNEFRTLICGRCHAYKDSDTSGGPGDEAWVEFERSYHTPAHRFPDEWLLRPQLGPRDLFSPGVGL